MSVVELGIDAIERGWVPDPVTRLAIRRLCRQRLEHETVRSQTDIANGGPELIQQMRTGDIAQVPEKANEQHYEVAADFFQCVLGPRLKYSSCFFESDDSTLAEAEEASLKLTCARAELIDGQRILELGCGWGSLSLWMAEHYPNSEITAVSNSSSQRAFIESVCRERGFENLTVVTEDMNRFSTDQQFERVVSVEMFEHMRNYEKLLNRISSWLVDGGKLFVHIFCHAEHCYPFETDGATNWMGKYFFSGGIMPSKNIFDHFQNDLQVEQHFRWNGMHYQRTLEAWLVNMDQRHDEVIQIMENVYGSADANRWFNRWRMFFMASAELFGYADGDEWFVSHYLLSKP